MRPESLEFETKSQTPVSQSILQKFKTTSSNALAAIDGSFLGGVIRGGQLAWFANGSNFEVFSLRTGQRVAGHSFDENSIVTCVAEVTANDISSCLLIIAVQRLAVGGLLYLFSVQGSRIVHRIDVVDKITSCCFISEAACKRGNLKAFKGCAAIGTDAGEVFLIDLNLNRCKEIISRQKPYNQNPDESSCKILSAPVEQDAIRQHVKQSRTENINLGIRLDISVVQQPSAISSILSMAQMQMIVVGLESGILVLFNLNDLNALHIAYPPESDSPLVKLTFLEPADDPRPCVYIWAFHANTNNFPFAVMHAVSFSSKSYQDGENIYETFQWCRPDLTIPIHEKDSTPISCQSVTKIVTDEEDEQYSLCLLAWTNQISSFVLVFDLNQWYKEQMPRVCDWRDYPSYLAPFPIEIGEAPLDIWLNPKSVITFNSIQRPEEHFYPSSLTFDLIELTHSKIHKLHWAGLQNNAIRKLSSTGAVAILMPDDCFVEFLEASLIPQLSDQNYHTNPSKRMKQEFLLSMALEYNCMSLLRECAQHWADGSHMGRSSGDGLTLSTLTDWTWKQATLIKDRCNSLCVSLFDDTGITIDLRSRKILAHYTRQLKIMADLLHLIITNYRQYIPDEIFDTLTAQRNSIRMTSEYQEVLQWLLNMGLLPEIVWNQSTLPETRNDTFTAMPYPYRILNKFYTEQRQRFYDINRSNLNPKTNSCKCLYIDSFIERECNSHMLKNEWSNGLGDGLYPPPSLQAMLRILLIPGISLQNKYMLFVYLFLDLHMVLEGEHLNVVRNLIKFPAVFKLNSSLIKTTQAFWNLDHNEYDIAIKELISPLTSDRFITQWQQELLVNTLLIRDMPNLALQAIRAPGPSINTSLRIKTLLANNLVTEAFELQRSKFDKNLLIEFFKGCNEHKKWNYVLGLSLTEHEGEVLCKFLQTSDTLLSENLQLLYLLQRNKYIEALTYLDETKHKPRNAIMQQKLQNTQHMIISSYKLAMNSTNRTLCDQYMSIKNRLHVDMQENEDLSSPLSSELNPVIVDANSNVVGGVFHRAILSAKRTGFNSPSNKNYIPLLGNIRIELDSEEINDCKPMLEPKPYIGIMKRRKEVQYENSTDPETKQPAAKRQRIDSFSIADVPLKKHASGANSYLLTSFANQSHIANKTQNRQDLDETDGSDKDQRNLLGELCETENLLSTPVVKSSRLEKHSRIESRCQTPQSILKQRHTEIGSIISRRSTSPSLTVNSARRSVDFSAKPFCYTIPSIHQDEYRLGAIEETAILQEDNDSNSANSENSPNSIKGRRPIHSGKSSTNSNSVDEFYSPETSKMEEEYQNVEAGDLSCISHQTETPETSPTSHIKSRRKLRSNTPEVSIMSSTRMTRSRSKLNLDESVDNENVAQEPMLNTSTPKRATPRRSPARSLSKNVIKSNAMKVQIEGGISGIVAEVKPDENVTIEVEAETMSRNLLKDASEMSLKHRSIAYSMDDLNSTQPGQNLLQDSSLYASEYSDKTTENDENIQEQIDEANKHIDEPIQIVVEFADEEEDEEQIPDEIVEQIEELSNADVEESLKTIDHQPQIVQIVPVEENVEIPSTTSEFVENIEKPGSTITITETVSEETSITITKKHSQNYLIDSSVGVSDSMIQKLNRYDHYTSSFFSETAHPQNLLEDSSFCTPPSAQPAPESASKSNEDAEEEEDVVDIDDLDDESDDDDSSSNNTISSEASSKSGLEGDLAYEGSESDEVIQISSSSEAGEEESVEDFGVVDSQDNINQYDELKYDVNDDFATTSQQQTSGNFQDEFHITELQTSSIPIDIPPVEPDANDIIIQEQAMNEMIYGDLGTTDAEMLDLDVHNDAFGFEMHGGHIQQTQKEIYLESVDIQTTINVQSDQLHLVDPSHAVQPQELECNDAVISVQEQHVHEIVADDATNDEKRPVVVDIDSNSADPKEEVANILTQPENIESETNILDQKPNENTDVGQSTNDEAMEITEMEIESTNIFDNAATSSILDMSKSIVQENIETLETPSEESKKSENVEIEKKENETKEVDAEKPIEEEQITQVEEAIKLPEKSSKKGSGSGRAKSPARRTRRAASQAKDESVEKSDSKNTELQIENTDLLEMESKQKKQQQPKPSKTADVDTGSSELKPKPKSRSNRTKSQQSEDQKAAEIERIARSASEHREFSIVLNRVEPSFLMNLPTEASIEEKTEKVARKKRGVSQQKDVPNEAKPEDKPSTSKTPQKRQRTKSVAETGLGDKFDAEESTRSRRLRKATSHQTLSDIVESEHEVLTPKKGRSPARTKTEKTPRRAASHQSLSSISDSSQPSEELTQRKTRAKSVLSLDDDTPSTPRTRRAKSQQRLDDIDQKEEAKVQKRKKLKSESSDNSELGDRFDADESSQSRRLRKAISHQTLSDIVESEHEVSTPKKGRSPSRTRSERTLVLTAIQDLNDDDEKASDSTTPKTRSRKRTVSESSDKAHSKDETESTSSKTRTRRAPSESKQSPPPQKTPRKISTRASKKDDDSHSETSSVVSSRSRKANDDDTSSVKSSRMRATRAASVLPPIAENEDQARSTYSQEYLESSRLTRSQRAAIEKYSKLKDKISESETSVRRSARKTKPQDDESGSEHSDTESIISQRSTVSRASKRSKTSETSSSQRTMRQRTQKK